MLLIIVKRVSPDIVAVVREISQQLLDKMPLNEPDARCRHTTLIMFRSQSLRHTLLITFRF